ncbi:MAG: PaaI family thioesterase [Gaiellaceae bacterium]
MPESTAARSVSNCFGCAPTNAIGLQLLFEHSGDRCSTRVRLGSNYESFPGIVHGGIVAAVMDETMAQTVYRSGRTAACTSGLRIRYGRPMATGVEHLAHAEITSRDECSVRVSGRIELPSGDLVATGDGTFYLLTDRELRESGPSSPGQLQQLRSARASTVSRNPDDQRD